MGNFEVFGKIKFRTEGHSLGSQLDAACMRSRWFENCRREDGARLAAWREDGIESMWPDTNSLRKLARLQKQVGWRPSRGSVNNTWLRWHALLTHARRRGRIKKKTCTLVKIKSQNQLISQQFYFESITKSCSIRQPFGKNGQPCQSDLMAWQSSKRSKGSLTMGKREILNDRYRYSQWSA